MKKVVAFIKKVWKAVKPMSRDEAVRAGICDYSGQGRDKYGR